MREDKLCSFACKIDKLEISTVKNMMEKVDEDYHVNMYVEILFCSLCAPLVQHITIVFIRILDNLPLAVLTNGPDGNSINTYEHGFPVGFKNIVEVS